MFNFDSRFFQSFYKILLPGQLTKLYISGKRKRYLNPARFFLFSMLFHFAVLAYITKDSLAIDIGSDIDSHELSKNLARSELLYQFDSLVNIIPIDTNANLDTLRNRLFYDVENSSTRDSFRFGDNENVSGTGNLLRQSYHLDDIINMQEKEFLDHYKIEGIWKRTVAQQGLRFYRNPQGVSAFFISNLIWAVALSLLFLSFVMKMLYIRSKRFYVEHFVLLMHIHCFVFILVGVALLIDVLTNNAIGEWLWGTAIISSIYFFASMYRYYQQGIIKTFFKFLFIMFAYSFIISIFALFMLLISMLIF